VSSPDAVHDTRERWTALLARLTSGFVRSIPADGSPAWPQLPGPGMPGHAAGDRTSGMEGFTRMSTAWAAAVAGGTTSLVHDGRSVDVLDPWTLDDAPPVLDGVTIFVAVPERTVELDVVQRWFPGGVRRDTTDGDGTILYTSFTVAPPAPSGSAAAAVSYG